MTTTADLRLGDCRALMRDLPDGSVDAIVTAPRYDLTAGKKGLKRPLGAILAGDVGRLVITHKDRLLRFGAELVFAICEAKNVEVVILNQGEDTTFEEDLAKDVLEIITVFSARLYGSRSVTGNPSASFSRAA